MKKYTAVLLTFVLIITSMFSGCTKELSTNPENNDLKRYQASFLYLFDTVTFIAGYAEDEESFSEIAQSIQSTLEEYHQLYDIYNDYPGINNIKTINDNAGIAPVKVDNRIIEMLEFSKEAYQTTGGLTNIALGSVLKIWHNYREEGIDSPENAKVPTRAELEAAAEHIDINKVIIDKTAGTVYLEDPQMSIDVGSIGKGYATEQTALMLEDKGIDHVLLSVGGNVRAVGKKPDGSFWATGIENPYGESESLAVVQLDGQSIVTSGNYQRYYTVDGVRYHHIVNPYTLVPENHMAAVAVLCDDSGWADLISTALYNMTPEEGQEWIKTQPDIEAMWMLNDKSVIYTDGFKAQVKE